MSENLLDSDGGPLVADLSWAPLLFVHSSVDDMGLSVNAMRVLIHLSRRAGTSGIAFPGMRSVSDHCEVGVGTVCRAVQELQERGLLQVHARQNQSNLYVINGPSKWKNKDGSPFNHPNLGCSPHERGVPYGNGVFPNGTGVFHNGTKGTPIEGTPLKDTSPLSPSGKRDKPKRKYAARAEGYEELRAFVVDRLGLEDNDAAALWEHWEGNGWKVNGRPMQSWKHTAANWERRKLFFPSLQPQPRRFK